MHGPKIKASSQTNNNSNYAESTTMVAQQSQSYNLALDEDEREELLQVLEQCVTDTREEKRHTDSTKYRDRIAGEESRLRTLLERLRRLEPGA
jgi:hypothetical protein